MKKYFQSLPKSLKAVFRRPPYVILFVAILSSIMLAANLVPNSQFALFVLSSPAFNWQAKFNIIFGLLSYFIDNETLTGQVFLVANALLAGLNISLAVFYFRRKIVSDRIAGIGVLGVMISFLGIGCGACGSVLISALLGIGAGSQVIGFLPLRGLEFSIFSLALLAGSSLYISKKIQDPNVCRINK